MDIMKTDEEGQMEFEEKIQVVEGHMIPVLDYTPLYKNEDLWQEELERMVEIFNRNVTSEIYFLMPKHSRKIYKRFKKLRWLMHFWYGITWKVEADSPYKVVVYKFGIPVKMFRLWF